MKLEEKARQYADQPTTAKTWGLHRQALIDAYLAGAAEALRSQWKDASKELPEMRQRVLLCYKEHSSKRPMIGIFKRIPYASDNPDNPQWEWNLGVKEEDVIGWMELPPLPNTEEQ